jgi:ABC-type Fe3+ transport system substrate-binding protein
MPATRTTIALFSAAALISAVAPSAPHRAHAADMSALYEAAKKEGALNLFGGGPAALYTGRATKFEQRFPGIKVNVVGGFSNRLTKQIDDARKAGKPVADLALLQTVQDFVKWKKDGVLAPFKPDDWDKISDRFKDPDGHFLGHYVVMIAYAHRPDLANVPIRAANDFLNPAFRGKLISTYPHDDDATLYHYTRLVDRYGWSFMDEYMKLEPKWVMGHLGVAQALDKGEAAGSIDQITAMNKGSSVVIPADEPVTVFPQTLAIFRDAPHPNAARLYVNWYMGKEEASTVPAAGRWSTRTDIAPPKGFQPLSAYKLNDDFTRFMTEDPAKIEALRARFKAYTGEVKGPEVR